MFLLYDLLLLLAAVVLVPLYLVRGLRYGKSRRGIRERLGWFSPDRLAPLAGKDVFWVHAVSVGETRAAVPLVRALKREYPQCAVVLSNVTETGHAVAAHIPEADLALFFPFDLSWVVRRVLRRVRPRLIAIVETEIWPNFVRQAHRAGIPVVLVNGRLSDRSFPRYRRIRVLMKPLLGRFSAFCMQTELDAERIRALGADPQRVAVTRNLKFDMQTPQPPPEEIARLHQEYGLPPEARVWVAGSTHAGEEEQVVDAFRQLQAGGGRRAILVLVPRHPERCRAVGEMLAGRGVKYVLRSRMTGKRMFLRPGDILLGDTLGEMLQFYAVADLVFVGGSLVPIGGHNVLEGSLLQKPVLFGPHMHNFKEISRLLVECGGGLQVAAGQLADVAGQLLDDPQRCAKMGARGHRLLQENVGATDHTLAVIRAHAGHG